MCVLIRVLHRVGQMACAMGQAVAAFMLMEPCVQDLNVAVTTFMETPLV